MFFVANDETHGEELWKSDGTAAGTVLVKDINPGALGSAPKELANVGGRCFFAASDDTHGRELWKSDGTEAGTVLVKDIEAGSGEAVPTEIVDRGGVAYFSAESTTSGLELWKSDGTEAGTTLVKDIVPGSGLSFVVSITVFSRAGSTLAHWSQPPGLSCGRATARRPALCC